MNERIQQLAEQANELDYETFDEYNHKTVQHYKFNKEKFAELIVKECLTQVDKVDTMLDDPKEKVGVSWVGLAISKHWGLE